MYVCICVMLSLTHSHTHAHTVAEQKVNSKTESTVGADSSKSKPQQHDAVTFFRLPKRAGTQEREKRKKRARSFHKSADGDVNVNVKLRRPHMFAHIHTHALTRFTLSLSLSAWYVCRPPRVQTQQHCDSLRFTVCVCVCVWERQCVNGCCYCWLVALVGLFWLFLVCSRLPEQQCN